MFTVLMPRRRRLRLPVLIAAWCVVASHTFPEGPSAAERRPIAETDLFSFVWVADPQIAPDGSRVAFLRVGIDRQKDQYETSIWIADASGREPARRLTSGPRDTAPRWSADGSRLAFVRAVESEGRVQPPQIFVMAMNGGEPRAVTDIPRGAGNPAWSPDGRSIAFSSTARPAELPGSTKPARTDKRVSDVRVITEARYRANGVAGSGFVDRRPPDPHLDRGDRRSGGAARGTTPHHVRRVRGRQPSVVSRRPGALFHCRSPSRVVLLPRRHRISMRWRSRAVSRAGWRASTATSAPFAFSRDGRRIAFIGTANAQPERSYDQPDLWVVDRTGGTPRNLTTAYDFDMGGAIGGDQRAPRGQLPAAPIWSADGNRVFVRVGEQGNAVLAAVDAATGKVERTIAAQDLMSYTADAAAARFAMVISTPTVARRSVHHGRPVRRRAAETDDLQRRAVRRAEDERAGRDLVSELRRQADAGLDPQAARLRPREEVPARPANPRRSSLRLRQHVHARVPVDGRQGVRRPLYQSARQLQLRAGVRQHHPVQVSGRRLQGFDGRRGRDPEDGLHRRQADGRDRRQRRRPAHQLGGHPDHAIQGRGQPARHLGLDQLLVHRRLHAVHAHLVPQGAVRGSGGVHRALTHHLRRPRSRPR